jgi:hypothetical protein
MSRTRVSEWLVQTHRDEKGETGEEQSQEHVHHYLWYQRDCSEKIYLSKLNIQFRILLCLITATAWKCSKTSHWTLATKELAVASRQSTVSNVLFCNICLTKNNTTVVLDPPYSLDLFPATFLFPRLTDHHLTQLRWWKQNRRRCWTPSQNTTSRIQLKKWLKSWERCIRAEGDYVEVELER